MFGSPRMPGIGAILLAVVAIAVLVFDGDEGDGGHGQADPRTGPGTGAAAGPVFADVTRIVDGDTVEVDLAGVEEDIRYIGVDTPETVAPGQPVECFGKPASALNGELVEGERVRLVFDDERRDKYGRLLAYVYVGDVFVNAQLVRLGYARTLTIEPNTDRAALFDKLEQAAGNAGRGLWGACGP